MIRTIFTPNKDNLVLQIPDEFIGKEVEVIAFVVEDSIPQAATTEKKFTVLEVPEELKNEYKFDRDEANER